MYLGLMCVREVCSSYCVMLLPSYRVFCMMGDGESAEGSIWEAAAFAGYYKLDNLVGIIDVNRYVVCMYDKIYLDL